MGHLNISSISDVSHKASGASRARSILSTLLLSISVFSLPGILRAQATPESVAADPTALVRRTSKNELAPGVGRPVRFKLHKMDDGKITTKEIVETKDGDVARLIAINDKPLPPDAQQSEIDRLNNLLAHPEVQEHRHKKEQEDSNRENEMIRLLPDGFLYHFEGMVDGPNGPAYRLSFKPNPSFQPPDREAEVYHGMAGELCIDQREERVVKLEAHLIDDVNFGWGILGRLYKGGSILVEQKDVGEGHWEGTHMKLNLHGKALMIKPLSFETTEDSTDFEPVPHEWSYKDAVHLLLSDNFGGGETQTAEQK
ncbi:MAG: hypothetical protein JO300_02480 [Silvibacterium sp.]|nr:hypothetical protein [Silvibacterium sp.]